ncbi:probable ATP-dependent RNA helicase DHX34 [Bacillus rossius redtenbacheri]|uniref:probable ATP-dependent RNA helicase DHX34 n=1 Tax=Bacillus rossius redtenbacheri TaxID=93214 RepID=UPI002FDDE618
MERFNYDDNYRRNSSSKHSHRRSYHGETSHSSRHSDGTRSSNRETSPIRQARHHTSDNDRYSKDKDKTFQSSDSSKDGQSFSFLTYRYELSHIWFSDKFCFLDQEDFWKFLRKYEAVKKKSHGKGNISTTSCGSEGGDNALGLPGAFDKGHLLRVHVASSVDDDYKRLPSRSLSRQQLAEFRGVLHLYLDFQQREKFAKLKKLRKSQASLPVAQFREEIVSSVQKNRVVVIAGDTGCGKSTQVPQYLLKAGFNKIVCTQPRRIACISLCKRVAYETLNEYGTDVGFQIRFEKSKTQHTRIVFVTEGLLLRQVSTDPCLSGYDVVVLDEVHERHLHGDFLLGVVKCLLYQRSDVKVVLMSATINIQLFAGYFGDYAAVVQVPGRLYPIKLLYQPVSAEEKSSKSARINPAPYVRIMQLIDEKYPRAEKGDLLIFLSGMSEISTVVDAARQYAQQNQGWIVLPLHSTLSIAEQDKCFDYSPDGVRKCVVSTNIAETSITIDGVRFVVDSGKVKEMSYDPVCKMQRLKEFWISRASAEQRKGRAGRTGPGVCYRMYSEEEYRAMAQYTTPEILRVPLDSLLLQMVAMGLPDARKFPFIESPPADSIENAIVTLKHQGALTEDEKLTAMGGMLARLPVDISLGKMLIMGSLFHQVDPILSLAAALSVQSPFTNRSYRDPDCETSRKELESDHGDPVTLLNALRGWLEVKHTGGDSRAGGGSRLWCRRRGLEEQRFYEMVKLRSQFRDLLQDAGLLRSDAVPPEQMSSAERALRHGELQALRALKRSHRDAAPQRRKTLRPDVWEACMEGDEERDGRAGEVDIKDVEFRLSNDSSQVRSLVSGATACSYKDVMMLKVILCAGLYPQLAVADEFNHSKSVSEQLFHTPGKAYVALHPTGFFGNHPQVLQLEESDIVVPDGFGSKLPVSSRHQLLCYMSLLETTKPYLVTTMRMPAAQTLLLFAQSIDTNVDFSRLVCDSWLQLEFPVPEAAMTLLLKAARLRNKWEQLLKLRLQDSVPSVENKATSAIATARLERELSEDLPRFMHTEVVYTLKRLLPADLKGLHAGTGRGDGCWPVGPNPFHESWELCPHPIKGGVQLASYLTFDCLESRGEEVEYETWRCPKCELVASFSMFEQLQHRHACQDAQEAEDASKAEEDESTMPRKPNSERFSCEQCNKTYYFTPTEILRHKKQHKQ